MSHYMDFDRSMITSRNDQMRREVDSLRLQERLQVTRMAVDSQARVANLTGIFIKTQL